MLKSNILFILLFIITSGLKAQENSSLQEVQVTENRIQTATANSNRNVTIISQEQIKNQPSLTLNNILQNIAGLDIRERGPMGSQSDINILGGTFEQTLILVDGIKIMDPQTGHHLLNLPLSSMDIKRIEILKGAAARVYGQNAYAGVVHIITKKDSKNNAQISASSGLNGFLQFGARAAIQNHNFHQNISLQHTEFTNYDSTAGIKTNSGLEQQQLFYQNQYQIKNHQLNMQYGFINKNLGENGFYSKSSQQYEKIASTVAAIQYSNHAYNHLTASVSYRSLNDIFMLDKTNPSYYYNDHTSEVFQGNIQMNNQNKFGQWQMGLDFRKENLYGNSMGKHSREISGLFLSQCFQLFRNIQATPGLCFNYYSYFGAAIYPAIDLGKSWGNFRLSANVGRTFRLPTYTEMYYTDAWKTSLGFEGLSPESAWVYEINSRYHLKNWQLFLGLYDRICNNQIDWVKFTLSDPSYHAINLMNIQTMGFEPRMIWNNPNKSKQHLKISSFVMNYVFNQLNIQNDHSEFTSKYVSDYVSRQFGMSSFTSYKNFGLYIGGRYVDRIGYNAYYLIDMKLNVELNKLNLFVDCSNVLNTLYYNYLYNPMPGRWLKFGFNYYL